MASIPQERGRSIPRPPSSIYDSPESVTCAEPSSRPGTKRLFSNRDSKQQDDYDENTAGRFDDAEEDQQAHSGKRHRKSDWPLHKPSSPANARVPLRNRNAQNSPSVRRGRGRERTGSQPRPSKFLEGSMNDRVSQKPPTPYLDPDEEARDRYEDEEQPRGRRGARGIKVFTHNSNASVADSSIADRSETSRHGIFRFGKSIAASFNPTNWKIWNKQEKPEDEETQQMRMLRERQLKAERIYQELKEAGRFRDGAVGFQIYQDSQEPQARREFDASLNQRENRDVSRGRQTSRSHIKPEQKDVSTHRASRDMSLDPPVTKAREVSREDKRRGMLFLEPPKISRGESPGLQLSEPNSHSNPSSPTKASFPFRKPSLRNMRKSFTNDADLNPIGTLRQPRRIPSRKDLHKQQRLVKRVSDLESKLETARRQLHEALTEPVPALEPQAVRRAQFVPGTLPSLPSERLLSGYVAPDDDLTEDSLEEESDIGKAISVDSAVVNTRPMSDARIDMEWSRIGALKAATAALGSEEKVLPSVEKSDVIVVNPTNTSMVAKRTSLMAPSTTSEVSTKDDLDDSDYVEEEDRDITPMPKTVRRKKAVLEESQGRSLRDSDGIRLVNEEVRENKPEATNLKAVLEDDKEESDRDIIPKQIKVHATPNDEVDEPKVDSKTLRAATRKRKSIFEREADDGGLYKPSKDSDSELSSVVKKTTSRKNATTSTRPRKLQKVEFTDSPVKKSIMKSQPAGSLQSLRSSPAAKTQIILQHPQHAATAQVYNGGNAKVVRTLFTSTGSSGKLTKSNPQSCQADSPPSSSTLDEPEMEQQLQYTKPGYTPPPKKPSARGEEVFTAGPGGDIPPMPKFPSAVRLASGEIVLTDPCAEPASTSSSSGSGGAKLKKARPMPKSPGKMNQDRERDVDKTADKFEWPDDVF